MCSPFVYSKTDIEDAVKAALAEKDKRAKEILDNGDKIFAELKIAIEKVVEQQGQIATLNEELEKWKTCNMAKIIEMMKEELNKYSKNGVELALINGRQEDEIATLKAALAEQEEALVCGYEREIATLKERCRELEKWASEHGLMILDRNEPAPQSDQERTEFICSGNDNRNRRSIGKHHRGRR